MRNLNENHKAHKRAMAAEYRFRIDSCGGHCDHQDTKTEGISSWVFHEFSEFS